MRACAQKSEATRDRAFAKTVETDPAGPVHPLHLLGHAIGNQALLQLLRAQIARGESLVTSERTWRPAHVPGHLPTTSNFGESIQPKLTINTPGDSYEQEADQVAEQVMRMPEPQPVASTIASGRTEGVQRACSCGGECDECKKKQHGVQPVRVQLKSARSTSAGLKEAPSLVHDALRSPGQALSPASRAFFEPRFDRDFSQVRVHTGPVAASAAESIFARAFTAGSHIVFGAGQGSFDSSEGRGLLAHELSHVVQQGGHTASVQRDPDDRGKNDVNAARHRAQAMVERIRRHGLLSREARAKINSELQYFEGPAKDAYIDIVGPVLRSVATIEMSGEEPQDKPAAPPPPPPVPEKKTDKPAVCKRLPEAGPGKKCHFFVYDSTLPGMLGRLWKAAAYADASPRPSTYVIPSGDNMEELLETLLSTYAEKECDCTDEVQFWSHGSAGNGAWISEAKHGTTEIVSGDFNIPGLDKFGDDTTQPGYQQWRDGLSAFQRRLVLLRRTICDSNSTIYYRSCQAFKGEKGIDFAKASSEFWRCDVSGHTKSIGLTQPGKHTLSPCEEPDWPVSEGADEEGKKGKDDLREAKPR